MNAPSPQDRDALLSFLRSESGSIDPASVPQSLEGLLDAVKSPGAKERENVQEVIPVPGFVAKTVDETGRKVFVNLCSSDSVPAPGNWESGCLPQDVKDALEKYATDTLSDAEQGALRFPLSLGEKRDDMDKKGDPCVVLDCVFNTDVMKQGKAFRKLKVFLIDIAFEWIQQKHNMELDPKYKLPKMKYKGAEVKPQRIRVDKKPIVQEIKEVEEDPTFALRTKMPKQQERQKLTEHKITDIKQHKEVEFLSGEKDRRVDGPAVRAELKHTLEFEGKPVDAVHVAVQLPNSLSLDGLPVDVSASTFCVNIVIGQFAPLKVQLPLPVSVDSTIAKLNAKTHCLEIRLPYRPIADVLKEMRAIAPHTFGSLKLTSNEYLELEA